MFASRIMYIPASAFAAISSYKWIEISFFVDVFQKIFLLDFSSKSDRDLVVAYIDNLMSRNVLSGEYRFPLNQSLISLRIAPLNKPIVRLLMLCQIPRNLSDSDYLKYYDMYRQACEDIYVLMSSDTILYNTGKFEKVFELSWK